MMQYEQQPSEEQKAIIEEPRLDIPLKVVAGAGSGKTFVLAHRFAWLVVSGQVTAPERILTLTFTNNAAAEMKMRIKRLLRLNGIAAIGDLWVHTFHSFAARLLRESSYRVGLSPEPQLLTEMRQQVARDRLAEGIFAGDYAQLTALRTDRLAQLGLATPDQLRDVLVRLISYAKSYGLEPDEFRQQAQELSDRFWEAMLSPEDAWGLADTDDIPNVAGERFRAGLPGVQLRSVSEAKRNHVNDFKKLYYRDLVRYERRPDVTGSFERAQETERAIIAAAAAAYEIYQQQLAEADSIDFDDQIMMAQRLLTERSDLRERYSRKFEYILVDEFQDTSPAQMAMLQALAQPMRLQVQGDGKLREISSYHRLMVVGDQKQSIYGWRDAKPGNLDKLLPFQLGDNVGASEICRPLSTTYRMDERLTEVANRAALRTRPDDPALVSPKPEPGTIIKVAPFTAQEGEEMRHTHRHEAAYIAEKIQCLVGEQGQFEYGDICVLMRKRHGFRYLKSALEERRIPYQAQGGIGFFDHPLACDLLALMRVVNDPCDDNSLVRLLSRPPLCLNDRQLFLLVSIPCGREPGIATGMSLLPSQGSASDEEAEAATKMRRRPKDRAIISAVAELAEGRDDWRASAERDELPIDRLRELYGLIQRLRRASLMYPARTVFEMMLGSISESGMTPAERAAAVAVKATFEAIIGELGGEGGQADLASLVQAVDLYEAESGLALSAPDLPAQNAVQVMTIHCAKGLGFPAVFVMAWDPTRNPSPGCAYDDTWGLASLNVDGEASAKTIVRKLFSGSEEEMQEEERLWYVALTRAKHLLCVTYAAGTKKDAQIPWGEDLVGAIEESGDELAKLVTLGPGPAQAAPLLPTLLPPRVERPHQPAVIHTSFSALRDVLVCPRRWWITQKWRPERVLEETGPTTEIAIGTCFHQYVAAYYRQGCPPNDDYIRELGETALAEAGADDLDRLRKLIEAFSASPWAQLVVPGHEVERPVHLVRRVGELTVAVSGKVDLVLAEQGQFADFKTNRHLGGAEIEDYALQMFIYQHALAAESEPGRDWQPVLVHVRGDGLEDVPLEEALLARQADQLDRALAVLVALESSRQWPETSEAAPCASCEWTALCQHEADDSD